MKKYLIALGVFALVASASSVSALGVDVNVGASANGQASSSNSSINGSASSTNSGVQNNTNASTSAAIDFSSPLQFSRGQKEGAAIASARANVNAALNASSQSAIQLNTREDMEAFIASSVKTDANIKNIEVDKDKVSISYKERARFLGIFPINVHSRTEVNAKGEVKVTYPWYRFLTALKNDASIQADLASRFQNLNGSANAEFSAAARAHILNDLRTYLRERAEAEAKIEAEASN